MLLQALIGKRLGDFPSFPGLHIPISPEFRLYLLGYFIKAYSVDLVLPAVFGAPNKNKPCHERQGIPLLTKKLFRALQGIGSPPLRAYCFHAGLFFVFDRGELALSAPSALL